MNDRTPLPLSVEPEKNYIRDANGAVVVVATFTHQAEHIVRCVNAHGELVAVVAELDRACTDSTIPIPKSVLDVWADAIDVLHKHRLAECAEQSS